MSDEIWTILKVLQWTQRRFAERGLGTPRLDAEVLLAHVLGCDRIQLYTRHDQPLAQSELAAYRDLIRRRLTGSPVAYLVGRQEFWSLPLEVTTDVLIPRPETEGVVEAALAHLAGRAAPLVADIGTGSGAIALAIARERPDARIIAVDRSRPALDVARRNALMLGLSIEFLEGDLLAPIGDRGPFDLIASNPPYIPDGEYASLPPEVRCEPRDALISGVDGLDAIRRLIDESPSLLVADGALIVEIGAGQHRTVQELAAQRFATASVRPDLAEIPRVLIGHVAPAAPR